MNVILDTNIWISFLFGKQLQTVSDLFANSDVHVYVSRELIAELTSVLVRPKIQQHISDESIEAMWTLMREHCYPIEDYPVVTTPIRDAKDAYILAMADAIPADYIVTGDNDLLVLSKHHQTIIVNYNDFKTLMLGIHLHS